MDAALSILLRPQTGPVARVCGYLLVGGGNSQMLKDWTSDDIAVMNERLATLLAVSENNTELHPSDTAAVEMSDTTFTSGWRLLDANSSWKMCPIGVYVG